MKKHLEWARANSSNRFGAKCCICAKFRYRKIIDEILDDRDAGNNSVSMSALHRMMREKHGATFALATIFRHAKECRR